MANGQFAIVYWSLQPSAALSPPPTGCEVVAAVDATAADFAGKTGRRAGFGFFKQRGVAIIEILQLHARDFLADEAFDGEDMRRVLSHHDGESVAAGFGPAGAADAVDVDRKSVV